MSNPNNSEPAPGAAMWCPECQTNKPDDPDDPHDVVLMRMDWRKASCPERRNINQPIGESWMCLKCFQKIRDAFAASAPIFDAKGNRLPNDQAH